MFIRSGSIFECPYFCQFPLSNFHIIHDISRYYLVHIDFEKVVFACEFPSFPILSRSQIPAFQLDPPEVCGSSGGQYGGYSARTIHTGLSSRLSAVFSAGYPLDRRIVRAGYPLYSPLDVHQTYGKLPADPTGREGFGTGTGPGQDQAGIWNWDGTRMGPDRDRDWTGNNGNSSSGL